MFCRLTAYENREIRFTPTKPISNLSTRMEFFGRTAPVNHIVFSYLCKWRCIIMAFFKCRTLSQFKIAALNAGSKGIFFSEFRKDSELWKNGFSSR